MKYHTLYKIYKRNSQTKEYKLLYDFTEQPVACFSFYNLNQHTSFINFGEHKLEIFILKKYPKTTSTGVYSAPCGAESLFSKEQIYFYLDSLKDIFPHSVEEHEDKYVITILESDYPCKPLLRAGLDFFRYLYEKDINKNLLKYFQIKNLENFKSFSVFELLQIIDNTFPSSYGHALPSRDSLSCRYLSKREVLNYIKKNKKEIPVTDWASSLWQNVCNFIPYGKRDIRNPESISQQIMQSLTPTNEH